LYSELRNETAKNKIIEANPFREKLNNNEDCFIHVRLGDVCSKNPGIEYYLKALSCIHFQNLYIASDSPNHEIVQQIIQSYPHAKIISENEVYTIQFGSMCKYIILSHGSFSAVIGYLAYASQVYYPIIGEGKMKDKG
jgi:hypothetical protein